ncbi:ABC transporter substrate-binding protein [Bacillus thermotolerans]|uniref:ABC transporter substrate-binding protein n=1 Tax=Bacillus thermotolerans TaxID=1221996 RepID=UPI000583BA63|nr:ABC transporter substrate-binding protein [Bacillus thermotolerans]KKB37805.1 Oligopeptide ABC transporter, periplasmic oligopeptide-binding protein OppA [Bacillus thermotolerans]
MKNSVQRKMLGFLVVFCSLILSLSGCAKDEEADTAAAVSEKKATLAFPWSPTSLDPHGNDSWEVMRSGTAETLVKLNEELEVTPWLAKEWTQENDKTWVFKLEENVRFHNGKTMDAASVKESLMRSLEKDTKVKDLLQVESMEVLSENELKIVTKQPNAALAAHLADPSTIIADVATIEEKNSYPALTGVFKFKQFTKDEDLIVERYEDYWGTQALLSEVTIKFIPDGNTRLMALQSGDVDAATDIPIDNISLLKKNETFDVLTAPSLRTHLLLFNMNSPLFKELNLRQVIDRSIPREDIILSIMMGQGTEAKSPFPEILPFGKGEREETKGSVEQLMEQSGWKKNPDAIWEKEGKAFEITLLTFPQRPELTVMAEAIQSELLAKGMKVNIRQVENIDEALINDEWDLSMYSMLTAHTGDPQYFLNIFYRSDSEANISHYASSHLDDMIDELNRTVDSTKRNQLALQIQEVINQDLPQSFIVHPKTVFGVRNNVKEFTPHPIEYYYIHSQIDVTK